MGSKASSMGSISLINKFSSELKKKKKKPLPVSMELLAALTTVRALCSNNGR